MQVVVSLLEQLKKWKLAKYYGHWKRRSEEMVIAETDREIEGKHKLTGYDR